MPSTTTVKTRLLLLSDTHFFSPTLPDLSDQNVPFHTPLPVANILIHAGDLTSTGLHSEHLLAVSFLRSHPAELKLVIAGNHDVTFDKLYYTKKKPHMAGDEYPEDVNMIKALYTSPEAVADGIRYLEEGTHVFEISNGAKFTVYASAYTPAFQDWAFAYEEGEDGFNKEVKPSDTSEEEDSLRSRVPDFPGVDIMITHGPPKSVRDYVDSIDDHVGCPALWSAVTRAKPLLHVFGHIHEAWGAEMWQWWRPVPPMTDPTMKDEGQLFLMMKHDVCDDGERHEVKDRGRFVDFSKEGGIPGLRHGRATLFVNASIMDVWYKPVRPVWVVDLDLPRGKGKAVAEGKIEA